MGQQLTDQVADSLAFDVACDYFNDEQLCIRYDLAIDQLAYVRRQPAFRKLVDETKRRLEDEGQEFLLKARDYSINALEILNELAQSDAVSANTRHKAAKDICELAGMNKKAAADAATVPALIINTNLALDLPEQSSGTYVARARAVAPAVQPGQMLPREVEGESGEDLI